MHMGANMSASYILGGELLRESMFKKDLGVLVDQVLTFMPLQRKRM